MKSLVNRRILVTGSAGFIGFHTTQLLLASGAEVLGVDNFSPYYDVALKEARTSILCAHPRFALARLSIDELAPLGEAWTSFDPQVVIHLAAQPGVRYSIEHPHAYIATNVIGTFNLLELARHHPVEHFLAASTSSVYGANTTMPFAEMQRTQTPMSLYAATKGATELIAHSYSHLYDIPATFFRFFTVYGPWGRPDMAPFKFVRAITNDEPIDVYNNGDMARDFTYVDDLAHSIAELIDVAPETGHTIPNDSLSPVAPFRIVNIGGGTPTRLMDFIEAIETAVGKKARKNFMPMQAGDVHATEASPELLRNLIGTTPATPLAEGVQAFVDWYRNYHRTA